MGNRIVAVDARNGITYIGKSITTNFESLFGDVSIEDYVVAPTAQLASTAEKSFCDRAREFYHSMKKDNGNQYFRHRNIQAVHSLEDL